MHLQQRFTKTSSCNTASTKIISQKALSQRLVSIRLISGPLPSLASIVSTKVADGVAGSSPLGGGLNPVPTGPTSELKTAGDIMFIVRCLWSIPVLKALTTRI